jgi:hypothetical protein
MLMTSSHPLQPAAGATVPRPPDAQRRTDGKHRGSFAASTDLVISSPVPVDGQSAGQHVWLPTPHHSAWPDNPRFNNAAPFSSFEAEQRLLLPGLIPSATRPETPIALLAPRTRSRYSPQKPATNISGAYDFNPAKDGDLFGLFDCEPMDNGDVADVDPLSNNDEVASACSFIKTLLCNLSSQAGTSDKFLLFVKKPPDHADALSKHIYDLRVQAL